MPPVKPTDKEQAYRIVKACITGNQELYAVNDEVLSIKMRCSTRTLRERMENPGKLSLNELLAIAKLLKWTPLQCASIIMGRTLTSKEVKEFLML